MVSQWCFSYFLDFLKEIMTFFKEFDERPLYQKSKYYFPCANPKNEVVDLKDYTLIIGGGFV